MACRAGSNGWDEAPRAGDGGGQGWHRVAANSVRDSRTGLAGPSDSPTVWRDHDGGRPRYFLTNAEGATPPIAIGRVGNLNGSLTRHFRPVIAAPGLGDYEVRSWPGWSHHVALSLLTGAFRLLATSEHSAGAADDPGVDGLG